MYDTLKARLLGTELYPKRRYLEIRPDQSKKQLFVKERRLPAFGVYRHMQVNSRTVEEASEDWNLPVEAVEECIRYSETHRELLDAECEEERRWYESKGMAVERPFAS